MFKKTGFTKLKKAATFALALAMALGSMTGGNSGGSVEAQAASSCDGYDFSHTALELSADMGLGINLGNTMDATNTWTSNPKVSDFETAWGQPVTTKAMIDGMRKAGFTTIRIPVAWSNMMSDDGKYTIDTAYLDRVEEIVNYALDNDMYVIVNDHYDGGWWDTFITDYDTAAKHYKNMWEQVCERFKNYNERLIFESANEELTVADSWEDPSTKMGYKLITKINQLFVDTVRNSGGYNDKRYLLIAGANTDITKTSSSSYVLPEDTIDDHMFISVHYYSPWAYCGMWEDASYADADFDWGTDADKTDMDNAFKQMKTFTNKGVGVIIGEFAVLPQYVNSTTYNRKDNDTDFYKYFLSELEKYGYVGCLWDTGDWYNKSTCQMRYSDVAEIFSSHAKTDSVMSAGVKAESTGSGSSADGSTADGSTAGNDADNSAANASGSSSATKKISLSKSKVVLKVGKKYSLKVTVTPKTTTDKLKFKSSNKKVATVTAKGLIKAKKAGKARITVTSGSVKKTVKVTVKK